jgi:hypothetical protein
VTSKSPPLGGLIDDPTPFDTQETWESHLTDLKSQPKSILGQAAIQHAEQMVAEKRQGRGLSQPGVVFGAFGDPYRVIKAFKNFWTSTFQPELVSDNRALMADPLVAKYKSAQAQEKDAIIKASESEWNYWNKKNDAERIRFLDDVETAQFGRVPLDPIAGGDGEALPRHARRQLGAGKAIRIEGRLC